MGGTIPGTVSAQGKGLKWSFPSVSPWITATFGVDQTGPSISIAATNFHPAGSPLTLGFTAGVSSTLQPQAGLTFGLSLANSLGITSVPQFAVAYSGTAFKADFYPLGQAQGNLLDIQLLPTPKVISQQGGLEGFVT